MSMSDAERLLLLTGTLDTSGVHAGEHAFLPEVSSAWQEVTVDPEPVEAPEVQEVTWTCPDGSTITGPFVELTEEDLLPTGAETAPVVQPEPEPVAEVPLVDRPKIPVKRTAKKTTAPKKQAPAPAES